MVGLSRMHGSTANKGVDSAICTLQPAICRLQTAECNLQTANCRTQSANGLLLAGPVDVGTHRVDIFLSSTLTAPRSRPRFSTLYATGQLICTMRWHRSRPRQEPPILLSDPALQSTYRLCVSCVQPSSSCHVTELELAFPPNGACKHYLSAAVLDGNKHGILYSCCYDY